ncbi:hypothetical protein CKF54_00525 [Psittacicella hinzii]|uniref:Uncharacterized protein n=1 Tax=Psittacicella hinzii TaxID=2028575 RepID=A0A3A1YA12_9GAMM|nr:hypothetical protein [Psittacicella hinzii]RIY34515.1 hypothetical protein CKF54_00525 [Psittacicella hinzii]
MNNNYTYWYDPKTNELHVTDTLLAPNFDCVMLTEEEYSDCLSNIENLHPLRDGRPTIAYNTYGGDEFATWNREAEKFVQSPEQLEKWNEYRKAYCLEKGFSIIRTKANNALTEDRGLFFEQAFVRSLLAEARDYKNYGIVNPDSELEKYALVHGVTVDKLVKDILATQQELNDTAQAVACFKGFLEDLLINLDINDQKAVDDFVGYCEKVTLQDIKDYYYEELKTRKKAKKAK